MIQIARNQDVVAANSRKYASQSQGAQINKGEEGKRRNERKKLEKSGKIVAIADFYADMGEDSPIQDN